MIQIRLFFKLEDEYLLPLTGARETKSVQTDDLSSLPIEAPCQFELEYACSLQHLELEKKSLSWVRKLILFSLTFCAESCITE